MNVLGITEGIDGGAAIVRDGRILAAVNEERLCRLKQAFGFPWQSIECVLRLAGLEPRDVDLVCVAAINNHFYPEPFAYPGWFQYERGAFRKTWFTLAGRLSNYIGSFRPAQWLYYKARTPAFIHRRRAIRRILRDHFGIAAPVRFIHHHLAHATSALFTSGFERATVVTMDGGGDGDSSHIYLGVGRSLKLIARTTAYNSLANFYAYVTHLCGYKAQKHEGKITGLAAHGEPRYLDLLDSLITYRDRRIVNAGKVVFHAALRAIERRLPAGWRKEDLAATIQQHCERIATAYVRDHLHPDGDGNVALAGGLFANVRINQKVHEIDGVRRVFVHPGMCDGGLAVGAALAACLEHEPGADRPRLDDVIDTVYLGPQYSDAEIAAELDEAGLSYEKPADAAREIARLLAEGYVVARFDGRMEYGPRALGNRSILYQPADPSVNDWLNHNLQRTEFMPFAPATLWERAHECYENLDGAEHTARFMTITFDCTPQMRRTCPGVVHIDGTARPQLVREQDNPGYYAILRAFERLTGIPSIINTSFNMHEEPIVCSPRDAIRAFLRGHLDYLAIGPYLVRCPKPAARVRRPVPQVASKQARR